MPDKTYYAQCSMVIAGHAVAAGDELGKGDIESRKFTPAKGLERVEFGHIDARVSSGRVSTAKPNPDPPGGPEALKALKQRKARERTDAAKQSADLDKARRAIEAAENRVREIEADLSKAAQDRDGYKRDLDDVAKQLDAANKKLAEQTEQIAKLQAAVPHGKSK